MKRVGAYEAKTHLPSLLDRVARGERFEITKHNTPVAVLAPPLPDRRRDARQTIQALRELRRGVTTGGHSIREMIEEGRRP